MANGPMTYLLPSETRNVETSGWPLVGRPSPVFLHSSFRTGSTWLWQKLRTVPTTLAFYEIFNEALANLTPAKAKEIAYSSWDSRHPPSAPYFLEFAPLLEPQGGLREFVEAMSFDNFFPRHAPDVLDVGEKAYIDRLIATAWRQQKIPVLSCTRTLGRSRAITKEVGAQTILLQRNLFHQWASYRGQAEIGNPYFCETILKTLRNTEHDPYINAISLWFGCRERTLELDELFQVFCILHLYLISISYDTANLIVDTSKIAADPSERAHVERELSMLVQHHVDLSDVRETCDVADFSVACRSKTRDTIEQFVKLIPTDSISPLAVRSVERAMIQTLTEWDRYEFFNRRTRVVYNKKIGDADRQIKATSAENTALKLECQRLLEQQSEETRSRNEERATRCEHVTTLVKERDALTRRLLTADAAGRDLAEKASALAKERDALHCELARLKPDIKPVAVAAA